MDRFPNGYVIDATYRVESVISDTDRAQVYVVTHLRFPETPLVLKVAALARTEDFERDTSALTLLTSPNVARVCDRGKLADGRAYRVVARLAGPTLREALLTTTSPGGRAFDDTRAMDLVFSFAAVVHEAQACGLGPVDLSVNNLMFADGRNGKLCLMRAIVPDAAGPSPESDRRALEELRVALELGRDSSLGQTAKWSPPASATVEEIRAAMSKTPSGPRSPQRSEPGQRVDQWKIVRLLSETLHATVYEVVGNAGQPSILKVAGPRCDHEELVRHSRLLAQISNPHVVRILDAGTHEDAPYVVMEKLHVSLSARIKSEPPLPFTEALEIIDDMIDGAEEVARRGGGPTDFSLDHAYQAIPESGRVVITHPSAPNRVFRLYGSPTERELADVWSAVVALYELITGRLPFPTSKHSLAKAWMGVPVPMGSRRRDVPPALSLLVTRVLGNDVRLSTRDLRAELRRLRATPLPNRVIAGATPPPPAVAIHDGPKGQSVEPPPVAPSIVPVVPVVAGAAAAIPLGERVSIAPHKPPTPSPYSLRDRDRGPNERPSVPPAVDWSIDLTGSLCPVAPILAGAFSPTGGQLVAIGREAIARYAARQWTVDPARDLESTYGGVRRLVPMGPDGTSWLALTNRGHILRLGPTGGFTRWGPTLDRFLFYSAIKDGDGFLLFGGSISPAGEGKEKRRGVIAKLIGESLTLVASDLPTRTLLAATKLADDSIIACGEGGHVARVRAGAVVEATRPCEVDLLTAGVASSQGGEPHILITGAGAWAFRVQLDPLRTVVEAVDTLSALSCMSIDELGNAWLGSSKGRILRRRDRHWRRMNRSFPGDPAVVTIFASTTRVRALLADGNLVRGVPVG